MNRDDVIVFNILLIVTIVRLKLYGIEKFFTLMVFLSLLILLKTIVMITYDSWLNDIITKKQLKRTFDYEFDDINDITTLSERSSITKKFPDDDKTKDENRSLLIRTISIVTVLFIALMYVIYAYFDFNTIIKNIIISSAILILAEMYFLYMMSEESIKTNIDGLKQTLIDKIIEKT